jgi:hypothetical protein
MSSTPFSKHALSETDIIMGKERKVKIGKKPKGPDFAKIPSIEANRNSSFH